MLLKCSIIELQYWCQFLCQVNSFSLITLFHICSPALFIKHFVKNKTSTDCDCLSQKHAITLNAFVGNFKVMLLLKEFSPSLLCGYNPTAHNKDCFCIKWKCRNWCCFPSMNNKAVAMNFILSWEGRGRFKTMVPPTMDPNTAG